MITNGLLSFRPTEIILTQERKIWKHEDITSSSNSENYATLYFQQGLLPIVFLNYFINH